MAGRILVLDDEENYASMLRSLLRQHNYLVDMSTKPELALAQLEEVPYDLVISDYKMPVMDGADFLKRSRELYPNLPVILVSGLMNTPELVKVANMSVTLVMEKPLNTEVFLKHVARFSTPMTEEEKSILERKEAEANTTEAICLPDEPKFVCASSPAARSALLKLWTCCESAGYAHIFEPPGGDAMLALKDLSDWKGFKDLPITTLKYSDFFGGGLGLAKAIMANDEVSHIVAVQLSSLEQVGESRLLIEQTLNKIVEEHQLFFAFIFEGEVADLSEFSSNAGADAVIIPPLKHRPLDLAAYTKRFLRMAEDQSKVPIKLDLSPDSIYFILSYGWRKNYRQLMEVILTCGKRCQSTIEPASIIACVGGDTKIPPATERMDTLLKKAQARRLVEKVELSGQSPEKVAESLRITKPIHDLESFEKLPLIDPSMASI